MPQGTGCQLGAGEVYGLSGTKQRTDRAVGQAFSVAAVPPPCPSGFWGPSQMGLLAPLALQGWKQVESKPLGLSRLPVCKGPERSQLPCTDLEVPVPQAVPTGSSLASSAPWPISRGSKGRRGLKQRCLAGIGPTAPHVVHPSTTPLLQACKADWPYGENGMGLLCPTAHLFQHTPGPS